MIREIALVQFFGFPLTVWSGIATFVLLVCTAVIGYLNYRGYNVIPFSYHKRLAFSTLVVGIAHGAMGLSPYLGV